MNKHKHYQAVRAFADGWKIETFNEITQNWYGVDYFSFHPEKKCRIVPDKDGWLPWYGGECPVDGDTFVEAESYEGKQWKQVPARELSWNLKEMGRRIVRYRIMAKAEHKKVKMWQWIVRRNNEAPCLTSHFYEHAEDVKLSQAVYGKEVLQKAEWTEIEVEE